MQVTILHILPSWLATAIARASALTAQSTHPDHRMACLVIGRKGVLTQGWNSFKSHPKVKAASGKEEKIFLHAEIHALVRGHRNVRGATAIVVRIRRNGAPGSSSPCQMCYLALLEAGIRDVVYMNREGQWVIETISETRLLEHKA